jgi:long-chain acyl-CoA synthetase
MNRIRPPSYPPGIPLDIDARAYRSVGALFETSAAKFGPRAAFVNMGTAISYAEMERLTRCFAAFLQGVLKLPRGARVALMMPNVLQYPIAMLGALRAGCTVVNCNPLYTPRELKRQLQDSGAEVVVVMENFASVVEQVLAETSVEHVIVTGLGDMLALPKGLVVNFVVKHVRKLVPAWRLPQAVSFKTALRLGAKAPFERVDVGPDELAFLQYTGGTTGAPKGAMLSHGNIVANVEQGSAMLRPVIEDAREVVITALPLYHVFALTANCLTFLKVGATDVLITNPRDIAGFVKELARHRFSVITGVNTLFKALLNNPDFAKLDFSELRVSVAGGMAVQKTVAEEWKQTTGRALIEAYGLSEASPGVAMNPLDLADYNGTIGMPIPSTEIAIRSDDGRDLGVGEVGELCVRGPQIMKGYWNNPAETAKVMMADGFMRTGDLAIVDEAGFARIVDRKKDIIIVSGFKVYPLEIEEVMSMCPGVLEAAAFAVLDAESGHAVKVAVVRKDPALTAQDLIAHCRKHLTGYKIPRYVEFRDELPKSPIGKVLRRALVEKPDGAIEALRLS